MSQRAFNVGVIAAEGGGEHNIVQTHGCLAKLDDPINHIILRNNVTIAGTARAAGMVQHNLCLRRPRKAGNARA